MKRVGLLLALALVGCAQTPIAANSTATQGQDENGEMYQGADYPVAMSGDSKWILTADSIQDQPGGQSKGVVKLWDLESGKRKVLFKGHESGVRALAFSPDGGRILSAGGVEETLPGQAEDNSVRLWDRTTGKEIRRFEGHTSMVLTVQFSPDGKRILSGATDTTARLWDAETGMLIRSIPKYDLTTLVHSSLSFSPSGNEILMLTRPGAEILDCRTGALLHKIEVEEPGYHGFNSAEYGPDGQFVVTAASSDKTARLWDARTGRELRALKGHTNFVLHASFSEDGTKVVTAGHDETVRIWNPTTGMELKQLKVPGSASEAYSAAEGKRIVVNWRSDANYRVVQGVSLWDIETGREIRRMAGWHPIAFTKDRQKILVGSQLWDTSSGEILRHYPMK